MSRFDYVKFDELTTICMANYKKIFTELEEALESCIILDLPEREKEYWKAALHYSEISYAMVGKALRDSQVTADGQTNLQEERGNE